MSILQNKKIVMAALAIGSVATIVGTAAPQTHALGGHDNTNLGTGLSNTHGDRSSSLGLRLAGQDGLRDLGAGVQGTNKDGDREQSVGTKVESTDSLRNVGTGTSLTNKDGDQSQSVNAGAKSEDYLRSTASGVGATNTDDYVDGASVGANGATKDDDQASNSGVNSSFDNN